MLYGSHAAETMRNKPTVLRTGTICNRARPLVCTVRQCGYGAHTFEKLQTVSHKTKSIHEQAHYSKTAQRDIDHLDYADCIGSPCYKLNTTIFLFRNVTKYLIFRKKVFCKLGG